MNNATGAIESIPDYRDHIASAAVAIPTVPSALSAYRYNQVDGYPVLMQAFEPACVAHSIVLLVQDYFFKKTGKVINFSARWIDVLMKTVDQQPIDGGAIPQIGFKLLAKYGCATEETVPNNTSLPIATYRDRAILTDAAYAEAAQYKIPGYIRIGTDPASLRNAIYFFGLVSTLKNIGQEWYTALNGVDSYAPSDIDPLRTPARVISGHQTTDFGWNGNMNKLRNSWSPTWDIKGNADYDVFAWQPFMREAWAIAEIPKDTISFLATLPSPANFHYNWAVDMSYGQAPSDDIKYLQIALIILGFMAVPPVDAIGSYGLMTSAAVFAFQQANGIPTQGLGGHIAGPQTRAALNNKFSI